MSDCETRIGGWRREPFAHREIFAAIVKDEVSPERRSCIAAEMIESMFMKRRKHIRVVRSPPEHIVYSV